jgi:Flp pilus assembly protein TadG
MKQPFVTGDESGAGAIEFALAIPILIMFIWGIFQIGLLFWASAGMQQALGEGARYATLYPTPTNAQIQTRITSETFGTQHGTLTVPTPVNGTGFKTLSVTYTTQTNFLFMTGPTVTLTRSKKVYLAT